MQRFTPSVGEGVDYESFMLMGTGERVAVFVTRPKLTHRRAVHWDPHR